MRFTQKGSVLYVIQMGWPTNGVNITSLGASAKLLDQKIGNIELLGSKEKIKWNQTDDALVISQPETEPNDFAVVFKISLRGE